MEKSFLKFILPLVVFLLLPVTVQATTLNYETAYMVRANNSHVLSLDPSNHYSYNFGETPWLYLKLKLENLSLSSPLHLHWVWSSFDDPNITEIQNEKISLAGLGTDKEIWKSAPQPWWTNNGGPGEWHVDVNWFNVHGTNGISSADFTSCPQGGIITRQAPCGPVITPEPLSMILFLIGGIAIVVALKKKLKTA